MGREHKDERTNSKPASRIEVSVKGADVLFYEHYSHDMIDRIIEKLKQDYGLEFEERCHSMCG